MKMIHRKFEKTRCNVCEEMFSDEEILIGKNPFQSEFTIYGCPYCKEIEDFSCVCDVIGCEEVVSSGWTHKNFYLNLCSGHFRTFSNKPCVFCNDNHDSRIACLAWINHSARSKYREMNTFIIEENKSDNPNQ